jgi:hypothetical protein
MTPRFDVAGTTISFEPGGQLEISTRRATRRPSWCVCFTESSIRCESRWETKALSCCPSESIRTTMRVAFRCSYASIDTSE